MMPSEWFETPLGQMLGGSGLDARLFTDLTTLLTADTFRPSWG